MENNQLSDHFNEKSKGPKAEALALRIEALPEKRQDEIRQLSAETKREEEALAKRLRDSYAERVQREQEKALLTHAAPAPAMPGAAPRTMEEATKDAWAKAHTKVSSQDEIQMQAFRENGERRMEREVERCEQLANAPQLKESFNKNAQEANER